jgi:hypothetical protein
MEQRPEKRPAAESALASAPNRPPALPPTQDTVPPGRPPVPPRTPGDGAPAAHLPRQLTNKTHVALQYQIDNLGPSGISKVEVWMTEDEGQAWHRLCEDPNKKSPVKIDLPGDGVYGLTLVVTNGNGAGFGPPAKGEAPDFRIEVDTSKPVGQLLPLQVGTGADAGICIISWNASDKNLKPEPIDLDFANSADGPWVSIVHGLRNDGSYRWSMPSGLSGRIFVRMTVGDQAGNTTTCLPHEPLVIDVAKPKAHVIGIAPNSGN